MKTIDASNLDYRGLNVLLRAAAPETKEIRVHGVNGQRYIAAGMSLPARLVLEGTAGNDLAAFADGVDITVNGSAQDGVGNTLSRGRLVILGHATDLLAHSMRGGEIYIRDDAGYRAAVHMKSFQDRSPLVAIGGRAGDFLGEYMAGGDLVVFGLGHSPEKVVGRFVGTGMHGGRIFIHGRMEPWQLGSQVAVGQPDAAELVFLRRVAKNFTAFTGRDVPAPKAGEYLVLKPKSARPYGEMYA